MHVVAFVRYVEKLMDEDQETVEKKRAEQKSLRVSGWNRT